MEPFQEWLHIHSHLLGLSPPKTSEYLSGDCSFILCGSCTNKCRKHRNFLHTQTLGRQKSFKTFGKTTQLPHSLLSEIFKDSVLLQSLVMDYPAYFSVNASSVAHQLLAQKTNSWWPLLCSGSAKDGPSLQVCWFSCTGPFLLGREGEEDLGTWMWKWGSSYGTDMSSRDRKSRRLWWSCLHKTLC